MNGAQDLGGQMGFGPVEPEPEHVRFHADWERRALALTLAMGATGSWTLDRSRFMRESLPPARYLSSSYYQIWLAGLERLLVDAGLATPAELASGAAQGKARPVKRVLTAADVPAVLARGGPCSRPAEEPARFAAGDRIVAANIHPRTHTRIPRYVRGRPGRIEAVHGVFVFPDTNAHGLGEQPAWLYSVAFRAPDLWGPDADPASTVRVDLFEPYLEPAP
ncbi:nitrile hydratase subunit beta [Prosthecomicrobium sp. N25]|uniref:nitrile hydratase subunit beta n=1 Tax=Prosthecomicrobium sp. N25 TaxID=3129254 RepID=UPI003076CDE5